MGGVACGLAVLVGLGIAYAMGAFDSRGRIAAEDVCAHTPDRGKVAGTLESALPQAASYSFRERWSPGKDMDFRSSCSVRGDGDILLMLTAEPNTVSTWSDWQEYAVEPEDRRGLSRFTAGKHAVANTGVAALAVPCSLYAGMKGVPLYLTVVAQAGKPLEVPDGEARSVLVRLATDYARQAHKDARCTLPSRLPEG